MANNMALEEKVDLLVAKLNEHDSRFDRIDNRLGQIDNKVTKLEVGMDEVKSIAKLGLEAVQGLAETTEAGFATMKGDHAGQIDLLKKVDVHLRKRVQRLERRPRRRN